MFKINYDCTIYVSIILVACCLPFFRHHVFFLKKIPDFG